MPTKEQFERYNSILLKKLSILLNAEPDYIKRDTVEQIARECELDTQDAYAFLMANAMYMDVANNSGDRELFEYYFYDMIRELDTMTMSQTRICSRYFSKMQKAVSGKYLMLLMHRTRRSCMMIINITWMAG